MNRSQMRGEIQRLRWPLLGLGLALLLVLGVGIAARHFIQEANAKTSAAEQSAAQLRAEASRLQSEEQDTRAKIADYQALVARHIIGPEQRLDWVELIRSIERERQLLGVDYEFQPQIPLAGSSVGAVAVASSGGNNSGYAFMNSSMRVKLALLHEEDLLRFVGDLQTLAPALIRVRSCRITRSATTENSLTASTNAHISAPDMPPQLQAECEIDWITLLSRQGAGR